MKVECFFLLPVYTFFFSETETAAENSEKSYLQVKFDFALVEMLAFIA